MGTSRILLFTPYYSENRGNSTTAKRIITGLQENGYDVKVFAYDEKPYDHKVELLVDQCDLIHIIHFYRFTNWLKNTKFRLHKPFILTSGGTDVNQNLFDETNRLEMKHILQNAKAITVFTEDAKNKLQDAYKSMELKAEVIPQSVWFPPIDGVDTEFNLNNGNPNILLPSGLREVKDIFYLVDELIYLKNKYNTLQFLISGMVLDKKIYETLLQYMEKYDWIQFLENVPFEKMKSLYNWADIVLNTSKSEGQSSALLEAMEMGCLVVARQNPGNASIIEDQRNGYLFHDGNEFLSKIEEVLNGHINVKNMIDHARTYVQSYHRFEDEIAAYMKLYKECLNNVK